MARYKLFLENDEIPPLKLLLRRESKRGLCQLEATTTPNWNPTTEKAARFVIDKVNTDYLRIALPMQRTLHDESGYMMHTYGAVQIPRSDTLLKFEQNEIDSGFRNNTVTESGGALTYVTGRVDSYAAAFTGSNYIYLSNENYYDYDASNYFSISFHIKSSNTGVAEAIITKSNTSTSAGYEISFDSSNKLHFKLRNTATTNEIDVSYDTSIKDDAWHHVVITYNGISSASGVIFYIDGVPASTTTNSDTLTGSILNAINLTIGAYGGGTSKLTASLDDFRIISKVYTAEQVMALYQKATILYVTGAIGYSVDFNGIDSYFYIPHSTTIDISDVFDISFYINTGNISGATETVFCKSTGVSDGIEFSIRAAATGPGFTSTGFTSTGFVTTSTTGTFRLRLGGTVLNGLTDFTDTNWHFIRIMRDENNLVSIYVDDVLDNSGTMVDDISTSANLIFGKRYDSTQFFEGKLEMFRLYKDGYITADEATLLNTPDNNPLQILKFGGRLTKTGADMITKDFIAQSQEEELGNIEVVGEQYSNRSPEEIIEDVLLSQSDLIPHIFCTASGVTITQFNTGGKLLDILKDLTDLAGKSYYSDGNKNFYLIDELYTVTNTTFEHGVNCAIYQTEENHSELVNDLLIIGENKRYQTEELASGTGSKTAFTLAHSAVSIRVEYPVGTIKDPEVDYALDTLAKTVTFTAAPSSGTDNIKFVYEYEEPLYMRGTKPASIALYGTHSKKLILSWIRDRNDGIKFISAYLNNFSNIVESIEVEVPGLLSTIREGDIVRCVNSIKGIDGGFAAKSYHYMLPEGRTKIFCGEFSFDSFENDKDIAKKIHDLEASVTTVKDLLLFKNPEEILALLDAIDRYEAVEEGTDYDETLALTATGAQTEMFDATYDDSGTYYDSDDAYV